MGEVDILSIIPKITIYGKPDCRFCDHAKAALDSVELPYEYSILADAICSSHDDGTPRRLPDDWRISGIVELQAMWVMCGEPTPFIVVDGRGYKNLSAVLDSISYKDRKKLIVARKRREQETNPRSDA